MLRQGDVEGCFIHGSSCASEDVDPKLKASKLSVDVGSCLLAAGSPCVFDAVDPNSPKIEISQSKPNIDSVLPTTLVEEAPAYWPVCCPVGPSSGLYRDAFGLPLKAEGVIVNGLVVVPLEVPFVDCVSDLLEEPPPDWVSEVSLPVPKLHTCSSSTELV